MRKFELLQNIIEDNRVKSEKMVELIDRGMCENFVEQISKSNRIFIYGKEISSNIIGQELKRAFTALGKYVFDFYKADEMDAVLSLISKDDCIIMISSENTNDYLEEINERVSGEDIGKFFIGKDRENSVPICTPRLEKINTCHDDSYENVKEYCMLVDFLYELCRM